MVGFLREVRTELIKVSWPTRPDVIRLTATVILISVFVGVYLGASDFLFVNLLQLLIK